MPNTLELTEGWTERIIIECLGRDKDTGLDTTDPLTGIVELRLTAANARDREPKVLLGTVGIEDAALRRVYFDPDPTDLVASESGALGYSARIRNTVAGRFAEFPQGLPDQWIVRKP